MNNDHPPARKLSKWLMRNRFAWSTEY